MGDELLTHRGYTIEIDQDPDGWSYAVSYGTVSLGRFLAHTQEYARSEARQLVDAHISKLEGVKEFEHRGHAGKLKKGQSGWEYTVDKPINGLLIGSAEEFASESGAWIGACEAIDNVLDCVTSERLGEMQSTLNALYRQIARLEQRIRDLEAKALDTDRRMTGSIQGLEGEWTVTPPPYWADLFDSEGKPLDPGKKYHLVDTGETVVLEA